MGFLSGAGKVGSSIFNFKVTKWLSLDYVKDSYKQVFQIGKAIFKPEEAEYNETFEQAMERMQLTEEILEARRKEFTKLMVIYILTAMAIFGYSVFIGYMHQNYMGLAMGLAITLYALSHAFRYHFWIFQIKNKKLGCSVKDWFLG